jgi:putative transposase
MENDMEAERYVDTGTAARLLDITPRRVTELIERGELKAVAQDGVRGRGGIQWSVVVASLPLEARIRYVAQIDAAHPVSNIDLITYQERFGDEGLKELWKRHQTVIACKAVVAAAGWKRQTEAKEQFADECGITTRTLYRWLKAYEAEGIAGLMDKVDQSNKGRMISMCMLAQDFSKSELYGPSRKTQSATYNSLKMQASKLGKNGCHHCVHNEESLVRREFALRGEASQYTICDQVGNGMIVPGTRSTFNRFVSTIPKDEMAYARKGKRYWEAHYMPKCERLRPERVNECWFGDHHMFDLFVIDDDGAIVRPWMTAWSDAATGCFVGFCITTNPNSNTITETFIRAVAQKSGSEFWGLPGTIYIDNGKDYRSKKFEGEREVEHVIGRLNEKMEATGILQQLGVSVIHALPYKAWSKTIERLFGTLENRYIRELPGWCGNSPGARPEDLTSARLRHMAESGELLTFEQFEQAVRGQIILQYHEERFGNEYSAIERYRMLDRARDDMPSWEVLDFIKQERCTRKVTPKGVQLNKCWYWHEDLRRLVDKYVTVRFGKDDDSSVAIVDDKHFICHALLKERLDMINADPEKLAAHMALQRNTKREVVDGINRTKAVADSLRQRNVIYETIDLKQVGYAGKTTTEFRRAAKSKAALEQERRIRDGQEEDAAYDKVLEKFIQMGRDLISAHD